MSRAWRAFYGATFGALFVLLAHPVSRPFLLTALNRWGTSDVYYSTDLILSNHAMLPESPQGLLDAGLWMELGAQKLAVHQPIERKDLVSMLRVASYAESQNADNAYWPQMKSVFYDAMSKDKSLPAKERAQDRQLAIDSWLHAANLSKWDDYQTERLKAIRTQLANEAGSDAAWEYAVVYPLRLSDAGQCIDGYSRDLIKGLGLKSPRDLQLRFATLMNGVLLRDGAQSIEVGALGAAMVEQATYPSALALDVAVPPHPGSSSKSVESPVKGLLEARLSFINSLSRDEGIRAHEAFNSNEGWLALLDQTDLSNETQDLRVASLVTIDLPGALLGTAIFGGLVWILSAVLAANPKLLRVVEPPLAPVIGLILGAILYLSTRLTMASVALVACFGFLAFTPNHERSNPPSQLGTVFEILLFVLSCILAIFMSAFFIGLSTPGCQLLPDFGVLREYYGGSTLLVGLSFIMIALLLLAAPAWAMAQRIATPKIVVLTLQQFGRGLFLGCLAIAILITPLCVIADRSLSVKLRGIVGNEPVYYQLNG